MKKVVPAQLCLGCRKTQATKWLESIKADTVENVELCYKCVRRESLLGHTVTASCCSHDNNTSPLMEQGVS